MATGFEPSTAPSPGFFNDSYQDDGDALALFDHTFGADASDPQVSSADAFDLGILPPAGGTVATSSAKPTTYTYPSLDFPAPADPYRLAPSHAEPTPPTSTEHSPAAWPLEFESLPFDRPPAPGLLPSLHTHSAASSRAPPPTHLSQVVTPPDDVAPRGVEFAPRRRAGPVAPEPESEPELEPEAEPRVTGRGGGGTGGHKGKSAATAARAPKAQMSTQPAPKPARRRPRKAHAALSPASASGGRDAPAAPPADDAAVDPKRSVFLERNRIAAYKCRQKKKEQVKRMEDDCRDLARRKGARLLELEALNKEYFQLKSLLLEHARTGCDRAQGHLQRLLVEDRRRGDVAREMLDMLRAEVADEEEEDEEGVEAESPRMDSLYGDEEEEEEEEEGGGDEDDEMELT